MWEKWANWGGTGSHPEILKILLIYFNNLQFYDIIKIDKGEMK